MLLCQDWQGWWNWCYLLGIFKSILFVILKFMECCLFICVFPQEMVVLIVMGQIIGHTDNLSSITLVQVCCCHFTLWSILNLFWCWTQMNSLHPHFLNLHKKPHESILSLCIKWLPSSLPCWKTKVVWVWSLWK